MILKRTHKADAVLAIVDDITNAHNPDVVIHATPYVNGREHGWRLHTDSSEGAVIFSENRNSDAIVVYVEGKDHKYGLDGIPSEEAYENRKFWDYNRYLEAALFVIKSLGLKGA